MSLINADEFYDDWDLDDVEFCTHEPGHPTLVADPYNEDHYCCWCGNGRWKFHAPWCAWNDAVDGIVSALRWWIL